MHVDAAIAPDLSHPVVDVLRRRAASGSAPGARRDPHRVALVLEGGGMRGVVSAAMSAALERLGLTSSFDLVVGSSAGAINGGALVAGVARGCAAAYYGPFASRSFVNPARVLWGRPVMSVDYVLRYDSPDLDAERHQRTVESPIDLHCVAVDVDTAAAVDLSGLGTKQELWDAILASSRMPWAGGATGVVPRPALRGRRPGRGDPCRRGPRRRGHARPRPADAARTTCRARATRGWPIASSSAICASLNPALVTLYRARVGEYETTVADIARRSATPAAGRRTCSACAHPPGRRWSASSSAASAILAQAAADAERLVEEVLA